jgi:anti-anti-sigma factor
LLAIAWSIGYLDFGREGIVCTAADAGRSGTRSLCGLRITEDEDAMKLDCVEENGIVTANVEGRLVHGEIDTSNDPIKGCLGPDVYRKKLLINLARTEFVDSAGISWLLICHKRCREAGGMMVIHSVTPMVRQVLGVLRLDHVFHLADDAAGAKALLAGATT